jgi:NADH-quinone oxidoreductase subunit J
MTTRPRLNLGSHLIPGLVALALFVVLALVFLTASFPAPQGFDGAPITPSIGYAMFDLAGGQIPSESFLIAFEIIDLVLIAALAAAVMLARREGDGKLVGIEEIRTDGGHSRDSTTDADADPDSGSAAETTNDADPNTATGSDTATPTGEEAN